MLIVMIVDGLLALFFGGEFGFDGKDLRVKTRAEELPVLVKRQT